MAGGAPRPAHNEPRVTALQVIPPTRSRAIGQTQRFIVSATLSDGTARDATAETVFTASDESVAKVSPEGEAKLTGPGEVSVLVRYRGMVATARVVCPVGPGRPTTNDQRRTAVRRTPKGEHQTPSN